MPIHQKLALRVARQVHDSLASDHDVSISINLPTDDWQRCQRLLKKMRLADQLGWRLAAGRYRRDLRETVHRVTRATSEIGRLLAPPGDHLTRASIRDIFADLMALHDEFDEVAFDREMGTIAVTTAAIELDGVYLGPFEIRLAIEDMTIEPPFDFRVIASDPHPAASDDSVTHPHVQDQVLCEGAGHDAIHRAIQDGRLFDFFVIVANTLRTYNSGSPYVHLGDWYGVSCTDCGATINRDERWTCEICDQAVCGDCHFTCAQCDAVCCNECATCCESCHQNHCKACISQCAECGEAHCQSCLNDDERCDQCHDQETQENDETPETKETAIPKHAEPTILADGVGQAAIPA